MEIRHLRSFVAVAEAGSFVAAARILHATQPAVSRQVSALERDLGVTLLERLPHGVRLSPDGRAFIGEARRVLESARRARQKVRRSSAQATPHLNVGYCELLAHWRSLAAGLLMFRESHPRVNVTVRQMAAPDVRSGLREGRIDVVLAAVAEWPVRGLTGIRLADASFTGVLLPSDHPVAASERVRLKDLQALTWYHLPPEATLGCYEKARKILRRHGFRARDQATRAGSFGGLPPIAGGDAWSFADAAFGGAVSAVSSAIAYRPLADDPVEVWIAALCRRGERAGAVLDFIDIARKLCAPRWKDRISR